MRSGERSSESPRMEESLGWARRKEVFAWGPWQWVTRGARRADRVSPPWHVSHVFSLVSTTCPDSNMQIKSSHHIIVDYLGSSICAFPSLGRFDDQKYFKSFLLCQDYDIFIKFLEQGRRSHYPRITLSSVNLSLAVYSVSTAGAKFRSLELHKLSKVTNSNHNYIPSVCHHPTKPRITSSKCRRVGNLNKVSWGGVCST